MPLGTKAVEVSVVVPLFNEASNIEEFVHRIESVLGNTGYAFELIAVDDGSVDGTYDRVCLLARERQWVRGIRFSRNFGKEAALYAGLKAARGRAIVTIDADLEHPPELIVTMLDKWASGAKIVHGKKTRAEATRNIAYRLCARIFTESVSRLTGLNLRGASDFKLIDRQVAELLILQTPERERFYRGLVSWVGFEQAEVEFSVPEGGRKDRRWSFVALLKLATTALVSLTNLPMQLVTGLGLMTLLLSAVIGVDTLLSWWRGAAVSGFATIIMTLLIIGSFIMISLGIIGLYIAKIYEEVKRRPIFVVSEAFGDEQRSRRHPVTRTMPAPSRRATRHAGA